MTCKMYVVPSALLDSILKKTKITDDPLLTEQVRIENVKEKLRDKPKINPDEKLAKYSDLTFQENILQEYMTSKPSPTCPVVKLEKGTETIVESPKKRIIKVKRPRAKKLTEPQILKQFYAFDPLVARPVAPSPAKTRSGRQHGVL